MLPLDLFARRNFSVANAQTLAMYSGISILFFFLTIYVQQVAGFSAFKAGLISLIPVVVMFSLSRRMGRAADRYGPRFFLTAGPLLVAAGFLLLLRVGTSVSLVGDVLPALLVFSLGLACTVAPLTATVLADADESQAGIASAVNNAIARTAGLISVAAVGAVVASHYAAQLDSNLAGRLPPSSQPALEQAKRRAFGRIDPRALPPGMRLPAERASAEASESAFHLSCGIGAGMLTIAGAAGFAVRNPRRPEVRACDCPGGQLAGAPRALHPEPRGAAA
jgi:hypothetical protein